MLFHSPLASSSCPFMVKWKQSWVKKVISIFPFCTERQRHTHERGLTEGGVLGKAAAVTLGMLMILCNVSHWFISCHVDIVEAFGVRLDYRETGRVCVLQEGLENNSKVVPEEPVAVQQLLKSFLWTLGTWKSIYLPVSWFITIGVMLNTNSTCNILGPCTSLQQNGSWWFKMQFLIVDNMHTPWKVRWKLHLKLQIDFYQLPQFRRLGYRLYQAWAERPKSEYKKKKEQGGWM